MRGTMRRATVKASVPSLASKPLKRFIFISRSGRAPSSESARSP
jgi:hypothetical protein